MSTIYPSDLCAFEPVRAPGAHASFVHRECVFAMRGRDGLDPGEVRRLIEQAAVDIRARRWEVPYVVCAGHVYRATAEPGVLIVDSKRQYSAAWL